MSPVEYYETNNLLLQNNLKELKIDYGARRTTECKLKQIFTKLMWGVHN